MPSAPPNALQPDARAYSSRLEDLSASAGWQVLAGLVLMLVVALGLGAAAPPPAARVGTNATDLQLYQQIVTELRTNPDASYYPVAAAKLRQNHFPLKPAMTVRLPTLAVLQAKLGPGGSGIVFYLLIGAVVLAWGRQLRSQAVPAPARVAALVVIGLSCAVLAAPACIAFHEAWAGVLMALGLGLRRDRAFIASVAVCLAAALIRETAVPCLVLMGTVAVAERRWREAMSWGVAVALFAAVYAAHVYAVRAVVLPTDLSSPGWHAMAGWPLYVSAMTRFTPLLAVPKALAPAVLVMSLFGWATWRSPVARRVTGLLIGYGAMLMLFARPSNAYWALMMGTLLLTGLVFVPRALIDLAAAIGVKPRAALQ